MHPHNSPSLSQFQAAPNITKFQSPFIATPDFSSPYSQSTQTQVLSSGPIYSTTAPQQFELVSGAYAYSPHYSFITAHPLTPPYPDPNSFFLQKIDFYDIIHQR